MDKKILILMIISIIFFGVVSYSGNSTEEKLSQPIHSWESGEYWEMWSDYNGGD